MELLKNTTIEYNINKTELEKLLLEQMAKEGHKDKSKISFRWKVDRTYSGYGYGETESYDFNDVLVTVKQ